MTSPLAPSAQSLGQMLVEEYDRLKGEARTVWIAKLSREDFQLLLEAKRTGLKAQ